LGIQNKEWGSGETLVLAQCEFRHPRRGKSVQEKWLLGEKGNTVFNNDGTCSSNTASLLSRLQTSTTFVNNQSDAQYFFLYLFIPVFYMFRVTKCSSSGESIVTIGIGIGVNVNKIKVGVMLVIYKDCKNMHDQQIYKVYSDIAVRTQVLYLLY